MGKTKRATRKELEEVISDIIQEISSLRAGFTALHNYVNFYIEWKGDKIEYSESLRKKFSEAQGSDKATSMEKGNAKGEKRERYKKISTPL